MKYWVQLLHTTENPYVYIHIYTCYRPYAYVCRKILYPNDYQYSNYKNYIHLYLITSREGKNTTNLEKREVQDISLF